MPISRGPSCRGGRTRLWRSKEARSGPLPNTEKLAIAGLPAVHAAAVIDSRRGPLALDLTWIGYAGRVYRGTGIAPAGRAEAFRAAWARRRAGRRAGRRAAGQGRDDGAVRRG